MPDRQPDPDRSQPERCQRHPPAPRHSGAGRAGLLGGQQVWRVRGDRRHDLVDRRTDQRVRADHDGRDGLAATGSLADQCRRILVVPDVDLAQR
jgi:hypothetical protein